MKRVHVLGLIIMLIVGVTSGKGALAATVTDVAPDHWAYQAVVKLVEEGYLNVNSQGAFEGEQSVDRYTLASVVAKILDNLSVGKSVASEQDVALLHRLTTEFRDELVAWYQESDALSERVEELEKSNEVLKQAVYENADQLSSQDQKILEEIAALRANLVEQATAVHQLETSTADHTRLLDEHAAAISDLQKMLNVSVENRFQEREMALSLVKDDLAKADAELAAVQQMLASSLTSLEETQSLQEENLIEIADKLRSLETDLLTSVSSQEEELVKLKKELETAKASFIELKENYEASQAANDVRLSELESTINSYQNRFDEMESELNLLRQRLITLEDTVVRIGKVVTVLDEELGQNLDANAVMALQRYRILEQNVAQLQEELKLQKAASQEQIAQMKKTNSFLMLGGGLALILLFVLGQ